MQHAEMAHGFFSPEYYVLDNFSPRAIEFRGEFYPAVEHAYQPAT